MTYSPTNDSAQEGRRGPGDKAESDGPTELMAARRDVAKRKAQLEAAIVEYVKTVKAADDAMTYEEWAQLGDIRRGIARRNASLAAVVRWARLYPRANIALGVYTLISFVSEQSDGCCWISPKRIGETLNRSDKTIRAYLDQLRTDGMICRYDRGPGKTAGYFPLVPRGLVDVSAAPTWFVDAFSQVPRPVGRPRKALVSRPEKRSEPGVPPISKNGWKPPQKRLEADPEKVDPRGSNGVQVKESKRSEVSEVGRSQARATPKGSPADLHALEGEVLPPEGVAPKAKRARQQPLPGIAPKRARMSGSWMPSTADYEYALGCGIPREHIDGAMVPDFRDHHIAKGVMLADASAAWRIWCRKEVKFAKQKQDRRASQGVRPQRASWAD